jgi:ketosteroid isomerase-like protein
MSTEETKAILDHHTAMLDAGDLDGLMEDYTEDSIFVSNLSGVVTGLDGIRGIFSGATTGGLAGFESGVEHVDGDIGYVTWSADGVPFGTDTFVIRDNKILAQSVGLHFA